MNAIFTGRKRSGKTTLAFDIAMRSGGGIIIYDPKREWRDWPGTVTDVSEIEEKLKEGNEVIVFHPQGDKRKAIGPLIDVISGMHNIAMMKGWDKKDEDGDNPHFTLIVDEAVNVSTAKWIDPKLLALVAENRPEILNIFLTFQSPMDANNLLKSRVDHWFIFNTSLPADLDYLNKVVGVPTMDLDEIQHLPMHEYAVFYFDGGTPTVEYERDSENWFRPLQYFELNAKEREDIMARREREEEESLLDLFKEFLDWKDDNDNRDRDRDRDRDRGRDRERDTGGRRTYRLYR
jgi:hypothetical protein